MFENFGTAGVVSTWEFSSFLITVKLLQKKGIITKKCK